MPFTFSTGFGRRLRVLRTASGLTQAELAQRSGLSLMTIARYEQGSKEPTWPGVVAIVDALSVDVVEFWVEKAERRPIGKRERRKRGGLRLQRGCDKPSEPSNAKSDLTLNRENREGLCRNKRTTQPKPASSTAD